MKNKPSEIKSPLKGVQTQIRKKKVEIGSQTAGAMANGAHPNFTHHGGPVIKNPQLYSIFLGNWANSTDQTRANRLDQFISDFLASTYMNILSQYGCGSTGNFIKSVFIDNNSKNLKDADLRTILQDAINNNLIPEPQNNPNGYIIFLDNATGIKDSQITICEPRNDNAFGYHDFFTTKASNNCYYSVIPGLTDNCLSNSCNSDANCSLHLSLTQEQRQTQVLSHEISEMISDPQLNAWFDPMDGENGDICNGRNSIISAGTNSWNVQLMYSKIDDGNTNGAVTCISSVAQPYPSLLNTGSFS